MCGVIRPLIRRKARSGQVLVVVAVALVALIGVMGWVLDAGMVEAARRHAQAAADSAAQAAAREFLKGTGATQQANARSAALTFAGYNGIPSNQVLVEIPPAAASRSAFAGKAGYVRVEITSPVELTFIRLLLQMSKVDVRASATAGVRDIPFPITVLALDPNDSPAISVSGNASIEVGSGSVWVDSSATPALLLNGNARIVASKVGVVGTYSLKGNADINGTVTAGASVVADPFANIALPAYLATNTTSVTFPDGQVANTRSGSYNNPATLNISGNTTMVLNPGIYWGGISLSGNASVTLNSGRYILAGGGLSVSGNASLSGNNIFFYNTRIEGSTAAAGKFGDINITGNGSLSLTAPDKLHDTLYKGFLFFNDPRNTADITITGNGSTSQSAPLLGFIYNRSGQLSVSGNGNVGNIGVVANTITVTGNGTIHGVDTDHTPGTPVVRLQE